MNEPRITQREAMTVVSLAMTGPYGQIPQAFARLYPGLMAMGLTPAGAPRTVFLTDPASVPEKQARWELWAPVVPGTTPRETGEGLTVREIPACTLAVIVHEGPYESLGPAYRQLGTWIVEHGYEPAGPPEEAYLTDPATTPPEKYQTEVVWPVKAR